MNNPGAKIDVYKQVNFPKLKDNLQNKKYWSEEDDQLSRICYDYKQRNIYIYSNDDLQEVYKFAERLQIYQWSLRIERASHDSLISTLIAGDYG